MFCFGFVWLFCFLKFFSSKKNVLSFYRPNNIYIEKYFNYFKILLILWHTSIWKNMDSRETSQNLPTLIQSQLGIPLKDFHCLINRVSIRSVESVFCTKTLRDKFSLCYSSRKQMFLAWLIYCCCFYSFMLKCSIFL